MNILIIEDEFRAANQLQNMLQKCGFSYNLLDTIDTVEDAVQWFQTNPLPDLVFMDIQLADGLSFEIFQKVEVDAPIIFTTAFDQYAIQAFKVNSVDYLLKPIQQEDLQKALDKFNKSNQSQHIEASVLKQLLTSIQSQTELKNTKQRQGLLVKEGAGFVQINIADLCYMYSEDSVTFGVTETKRYVIDETIDQLFSTLNHEDFYKINRGQIVAKRAILKIHPYFNHRVKLSMQNERNQEFIVSRQKTSDFKAWLNW
ncbi:LytTR family two component transcriptional regulator [Kordia periserrulae]|uniref:LytTR family two component transcriptional regulator n=1 Tax=Kordia periserrulae TaxID=701523 RepID=A0A2T6C745_9FLAO|nr:LytTR family DNA-binding domain-containing protein [Kordia periserrulae]PTX64106.1 LytTR family two component transcriptional regulator [Kordia periserrulae]